MRDKNGRFLPGISGNPGGCPSEVDNVRELALEHSDAGCGAAARALLDGGYGKSVAVYMDVVDEG